VAVVREEKEGQQDKECKDTEEQKQPREEEQAATKLQSMHRGRVGRKQAQECRTAKILAEVDADFEESVEAEETRAAPQEMSKAAVAGTVSTDEVGKEKYEQSVTEATQALWKDVAEVLQASKQEIQNDELNLAIVSAPQASKQEIQNEERNLAIVSAPQAAPVDVDMYQKLLTVGSKNMQPLSWETIADRKLRMKTESEASRCATPEESASAVVVESDVTSGPPLSKEWLWHRWSALKQEESFCLEDSDNVRSVQQCSISQLTSPAAFYKKLKEVTMPPPPTLPPPKQQRPLSAKQKREQEKLANALPTVNSTSRSLRTSQRTSGVQTPSMTPKEAQDAILVQEPTEESNRALLNQLRSRLGLDDAFPSALREASPSSPFGAPPQHDFGVTHIENQARQSQANWRPQAESITGSCVGAPPQLVSRVTAKESQTAKPGAEGNADNLLTEVPLKPLSRVVEEPAASMLSPVRVRYTPQEEPRVSTPKFGEADRSSVARAYVSSSQSAIATAQTAEEAADAAVALLLMM